MPEVTHWKAKAKAINPDLKCRSTFMGSGYQRRYAIYLGDFRKSEPCITREEAWADAVAQLEGKPAQTRSVLSVKVPR